jgi:hypothetical protein
MLSMLRNLFSAKCALCGNRSASSRTLPVTVITEHSTTETQIELCYTCAPVCQHCGFIPRSDKLKSAGIVSINHQDEITGDSLGSLIFGSMSASPPRIRRPKVVLRVPFCDCRVGSCDTCGRSPVPVREFEWSHSSARMDGSVGMCLNCAPVCPECGRTRRTVHLSKWHAKNPKLAIGMPLCKCQ